MLIGVGSEHIVFEGLSIDRAFDKSTFLAAVGENAPGQTKKVARAQEVRSLVDLIAYGENLLIPKRRTPLY